MAQAEDASRVSTLSRGSAVSLDTSLRTRCSGETGSLPSLMTQNDWEIAPMDIEIMRREDGSPWELGAGAFGKVGGHCYHTMDTASFATHTSLHMSHSPLLGC
jgi:hypothetical protein